MRGVPEIASPTFLGRKPNPANGRTLAGSAVYGLSRLPRTDTLAGFVQAQGDTVWHVACWDIGGRFTGWWGQPPDTDTDGGHHMDLRIP